MCTGLLRLDVYLVSSPRHLRAAKADINTTQEFTVPREIADISHNHAESIFAMDAVVRPCYAGFPIHLHASKLE